MPDRINRFRQAIVDILEAARTCDPDFRQQYLALIEEMQAAIEEMQELQDPTPDPTESAAHAAVREN